MAPSELLTSCSQQDPTLIGLGASVVSILQLGSFEEHMRNTRQERICLHPSRRARGPAQLAREDRPRSGKGGVGMGPAKDFCKIWSVKGVVQLSGLGLLCSSRSVGRAEGTEMSHAPVSALVA